jgi:CheY-like chemotaxis protein
MSRFRILAVDDDAGVVRVVRGALADAYAMVVETDPVAALGRLAQGERFDLVLCDVMMPGLTGMDLHEAVARLDPAQAARMVFMTGGAFSARARAFLADPARVWLAKPFDPLELRRFVADALAAGAVAVSPI